MVIQPARIKPLVVFDMAARLDPRRPTVVTTAARFLSSALNRKRLATSYFMKKFIVQGGQLELPAEIKPDQRQIVFALTLFDSGFMMIKEEVEKLRRLYPQALIALGGPAVNTATDLRDLASFFPEVNVFVKGDGEKPFVEIIKALNNSQIDRDRLSKLTGVYIRIGDYTYYNNQVNALSEKEFNELSFTTLIYPDLIEDIKQDKFLSLNTSRSCKYRCLFCSHKYHPEPLYWTAERIVQELVRIKSLIAQGILPPQAKNIVFDDDDFFQDRSRALRFLELVKQDPALRNYFSFNFQSSIASFYAHHHGRKADLELINALQGLKLMGINFGTDGFCPQALRYYKKGGYTWEMAKNLMQILSERGVYQFHYAIMTFPEITKEEFIETLKNMKEVLAKYSRHLRVKILWFPTAYESNQLMGKGYPIQELQVIESATEVKRTLPYSVGLNDRALTEKIMATLNLPLPRQREFFNAIRHCSSKEQRREYQQARKTVRRFPAEMSVGGALGETTSPYLQRIVINHMLRMITSQ